MICLITWTPTVSTREQKSLWVTCTPIPRMMWPNSQLRSSSQLQPTLPSPSSRLSTMDSRALARPPPCLIIKMVTSNGTPAVIPLCQAWRANGSPSMWNTTGQPRRSPWSSLDRLRPLMPTAQSMASTSSLAPTESRTATMSRRDSRLDSETSISLSAKLEWCLSRFLSTPDIHRLKSTSLK